MTLPEATTGIISDLAAMQLDQGGGGGEPTLIIPRVMDPALNSFSAATLTDAAGTAAASVKNTLSSAASSVSTAAQSVWATVTGKDSAPAVNISTGTPASAGGSLTWLWVLLAAGGAYLVYHFTAGGAKGKKSFFKPRASGSHVKSYGKS